MEAELWNRVEKLFHVALAHPAESRAEFLRQACAGDAQLQSEVETLLENACEEGSFLNGSPLGAALSAGQRLGNFEIVGPLGIGGMGEVYRARDSRLKREVAIKVLPRAFARDTERLARFEREARSASALNHPNIVGVYDIGRQDDTAWIASELVEGQSLRQLLTKGPLPLRRVIEIARQIADGLAAAHAAGLVHRDIKPENIMLARDGRVKILDFGLAKRQASEGKDASTGITRPGIVTGTPAYMSPEQIAGRTVDQRSDIFSLGVVVYEMLTGKRPFAGDTSVTVMNAVLTEEPAELPDAVPPTVAKLVLHCLEKAPERRSQSAADLSFALQLPEPQKVSAHEKRRLWWRALALGLSLFVAVPVLWRWPGGTPKSPPPLVLTRVTTDAGLTTDPALSPDGTLLAYASDRSGDENLDIWVQQTAGGAPIRLTKNEADDHQPAFSPDGSMIAFRSERNGGGIYVMSALGGDERLVAQRGLRPQFSPDGSEIAYYVGDQGDLFSRNTGKIYVVGSAGGAAKQLQSGFVAARFPVWSPDGKHILFIGTEEALKEGNWDWYVAAVSGGPAVKTGAFQAIGKQKLLKSGFFVPLVWVRDANRILFAGGLGDSVNLWELQIAEQSWVIQGGPRRVTSGTGLEMNATVAGNRLAFTASAESMNIWTLPIDSAKGEPRGPIKQATEGLSSDLIGDISADGKKVVFSSNRTGHSAIWIKDLESGKEQLLSGRGQDVGDPRITADGMKVGYGPEPGPGGTSPSSLDIGAVQATASKQTPLYVVPASGGIPEKVCDSCAFYWNWSSDRKKILYVHRNKLAVNTQIFMEDTESKRKTTVLQNPEFNLYQPAFSPDNRWIAFTAQTPRSPVQQFIAPFRGERSIPETDWIEAGEGGDVHWSPGGNSIFSVSDRDGFKCLWSQRLDRDTKKPVGPPICVKHFHRARVSLADVAVARDKIALNLNQLSGNIWMANLDGALASRSVE